MLHYLTQVLNQFIYQLLIKVLLFGDLFHCNQQHAIMSVLILLIRSQDKKHKENENHYLICMRVDLVHVIISKLKIWAEIFI